MDITERRMQLGLTQAQLASMVGVTSTTAYNWETGRNLPQLAHFSALARALQVAPKQLTTMLDEIASERAQRR